MTADVPRERRLPFAGPLDLPRTVGGVRFGKRDPTALIEAGAVHRATRTPEGPATFQLGRDGGEVVARAWGPGADWILGRAATLAGLEDEPSALTAAHPIVAELQRQLPGLRLGHGLPILEVIFPVILGQRVTSAESKAGWSAVVRALGEPAPGPFELLLPPAPQALHETPWYEYGRLGIEKARADVIREVAAHAGRVAEAAAMAPQDAYRRLTAVRGVGPWTAWKTLAMATGYPDAVPTGDWHLPNMVAWALAGEPRGDDARMLTLLEPYRGQRWRVLQLLKLGGVKAPRRGPKQAIWRWELGRKG